jgi:hypothetical protein
LFLPVPISSPTTHPSMFLLIFFKYACFYGLNRRQLETSVSLKDQLDGRTNADVRGYRAPRGLTIGWRKIQVFSSPPRQIPSNEYRRWGLRRPKRDADHSSLVPGSEIHEALPYLHRVKTWIILTHHKVNGNRFIFTAIIFRDGLFPHRAVTVN